MFQPVLTPQLAVALKNSCPARDAFCCGCLSGCVPQAALALLSAPVAASRRRQGVITAPLDQTHLVCDPLVPGELPGVPVSLQVRSQSKPWKYSSQSTFLPKTQLSLRALLLLGLNWEHSVDPSSLFCLTQDTELKDVTAVLFVPSSPPHSTPNKADTILPFLLAWLAIFQVLGVFMITNVTPQLGMGRGILNIPTLYPSSSGLSNWKGTMQCVA